MSHPNDKATVREGGYTLQTEQTNGEIYLTHLSPEVLRDLARNEAASKEWRKAAVALLTEKKHYYAQHGDLRELVLELKAEQEARLEVEALATVAAPDPNAPIENIDYHGRFVVHDVIKEEEERKAIEDAKVEWHTTDPDAEIPSHSGVTKVVLPSAEDLDAVAEEKAITDATNEGNPITDSD